MSLGQEQFEPTVQETFQPTATDRERRVHHHKAEVSSMSFLVRDYSHDDYRTLKYDQRSTFDLRPRQRGPRRHVGETYPRDACPVMRAEHLHPGEPLTTTHAWSTLQMMTSLLKSEVHPSLRGLTANSSPFITCVYTLQCKGPPAGLGSEGSGHRHRGSSRVDLGAHDEQGGGWEGRGGEGLGLTLGKCRTGDEDHVKES